MPHEVGAGAQHVATPPPPISSGVGAPAFQGRWRRLPWLAVALWCGGWGLSVLTTRATSCDPPLQHSAPSSISSSTNQVPSAPSRSQAAVPKGLLSRSDLLRWAGALGLVTAATPAPAVAPSAPRLPPSSRFLSRLQQLPIRTDASATVSKAFSVYLTGYLIRFDKEWRTWWKEQVRATPSYYRPAYIFDSARREQVVRGRYREVTRALLRRVEGVDLDALCQLLYDDYSPLSSRAAKHHLAILFAFLDAKQQPRPLIVGALQQELQASGVPLSPAEVLRRFTSYAEILRPNQQKVAEASVSLGSGFYTPQLLPSNLYPLYDVGLKQWVVPESSEMTKFPNERGDIILGSLDADEPYALPNSLAFTWFTLLFLAYSGGLSNAITYSLVQPLEVWKIRMQATGRSAGETLGALRADMGWRGLTIATGATALGKFMYGYTIFPFFELGKLFVADAVGEDLVNMYRLPFVLAVSSVCTLVGSAFEVPFETVKIKMIANPEKYSLPPAVTLSSSGDDDAGPGAVPASEGRRRMLPLWDVFNRVRDTEGWWSLWAGYPALLLRNILCNVGRFTVFDAFDDALVFFLPAAATLVSGPGPVPVSLLLVKGVVTGMSSAIFSTPADSVLTQITRSSRAGRHLSLAAAARAVFEEQGLPGFYRGLLPRMAWSILVNTSQVFCYQSLKDLFFDSILLGSS